jgi:hypothetical protein
MIIRCLSQAGPALRVKALTRRVFTSLALLKKCPRGGFPVPAELKFLIDEAVTVDTKMPCPAR